MINLYSPIIFALLLASTSALAQSKSDGGHSMQMEGQAGGSGQMMHGGQPAQGADAEFHDGMMTMQNEMMSKKPSGNPDQDFASTMIVHHRGAVNMAQVELKYGKDPELRKLAQEIIAAQNKEISFMESWQAKNKK